MDSIKVSGIVVRTVDYGEADVILTLVTLEQGKLTASAKSVKKAKAKLKYAAAPFSFGEYVLAPSRGGKLIVTDCVQQESFFELTTRLDCYYAGFILLEVLDKLSNQDANPTLVLAVLNGLKELAYGANPPKITLVATLVSVLAESGYALNFDTCACCGRPLGRGVSFDFSSGFVCAGCPVPDGVGVPDDVFDLTARLSNISEGEIVETEESVLSASAELALLLVTRVCGIKLVTARYLSEI